jgi:hypothetical protein
MVTRVPARRAVADTLIAAASLLVLLLGLLVVDTRVRERALLLLDRNQLADGLTSVSDRLVDLGRISLQAARDQGMEHAPVVIFVVAAAVLTIFMLRT